MNEHVEFSSAFFRKKDTEIPNEFLLFKRVSLNGCFGAILALNGIVLEYKKKDRDIPSAVEFGRTTDRRLCTVFGTAQRFQRMKFFFMHRQEPSEFFVLKHMEPFLKQKRFGYKKNSGITTIHSIATTRNYGKQGV